MSLGIAFAGGGLKGIAHIGAIKALQELNITPDYISGTSSGSIIAGLLAMNFSTDEISQVFQDYYKILTKIEKKRLAKSGFNFLTTGSTKIDGLIDGQKVEDIIASVAEKKQISKMSDISIPLAIPTVDTITTKECVFLNTPIYSQTKNVDYIYNANISTAIRASMAFPAIFTPCNYENYSFIDGGTKDNLPVQILKDMGATKTLAINFRIDDYTPEDDIFKVILRAVDIFSLKDVRKAQKESDLAIEIDANGTSLLSIDNLEECINIGYNAIMNHKDELLQLLSTT